MTERSTATARFLARMLGCAVASIVAHVEAATAGGPAISIEQAYDIALATDQSIRIAYWEVRKASLLPWAALTRLGPQLSGNASYRRREASTTASVLETGAVSSFERTTNTRAGTGDIGLTFQQPLIDLTVFPAYRLGKLSAEVAKLQRQFTVRETLFGVTSAYFEVLKQERLVAGDSGGPPPPDGKAHLPPKTAGCRQGAP